MRRPKSGGGWQAIRYTWTKGREAGGVWKLWKAMRSKNACKTCALGMGGQKGGMVNEAGHFPGGLQEIAAGDGRRHAGGDQARILAAPIRSRSFRRFSPRELEACGRLTQPLSAPRGRAITIGRSRWDDALARIVEQAQVASLRTKRFGISAAAARNEAGFLLQLFARLYGTNNVNNCSYYCHQASGVGLTIVARHRHGDGARLTTSSTPTWCS